MGAAQSGRTNGFVFVFALGISLIMAELVVRLVLPRPGFLALPIAEVGGVIVPHPTRGHAYAENLNLHFATDDYEIDFETNKLGMRDQPIGSVSDEGLRILAVGDSFTQGHGVQLADAWPKQLEARFPGSRVYNTGVSGYGLQQMRATAEFFVPELQPQLIVVGLYGYGYNRIRDPYVIAGAGGGLVRQKMRDRVRVVEEGVLVEHFQTPTVRDVALWLDQHWHVGAHALHVSARLLRRLRQAGGPPIEPVPQSLPDLQAAMEPMLAELARFKQFADARGIPFVALLINSQEPDGSYSAAQLRYNEIILANGRVQGLCVVDPLPSMIAHAAGRPVFRFPGDKHWSPAAHAFAVGALLSKVSQHTACRDVRAALPPVTTTHTAQ